MSFVPASLSLFNAMFISLFDYQVVLSSVSGGILLSRSGTNYPSGLKDKQMTDDPAMPLFIRLPYSPI